MNSSKAIQDKAYRPFLWTLLLPVLTVCAVAFPAYLYYGAPVGGLTRIGFWPERDYVQRLEQTPIVLVENSAKMAQVDILVIGDSFAFSNVWQSVASEKTGLIFQTHGYPNGKDCFVDWVKNRTQAPAKQVAQKIVIVETVERAFLWRMKDFSRCDDRAEYPLIAAVAGARWSVGTTSVFNDIDLMRQMQTIKNQAQLAISPDDKLGGAARNALLINSKLFSNVRSDRLLYLDHDENRLGWTKMDIQQAVQNLKALQLDIASRGYRLIVLIVPDKVHVYEDALAKPWPLHAGTNVAKNLRDAGIDAPDLLGALKIATRTQQDVYLPNDTHTSEAGYRVIGETVAQTLNAR